MTAMLMIVSGRKMSKWPTSSYQSSIISLHMSCRMYPPNTDTPPKPQPAVTAVERRLSSQGFWFVTISVDKVIVSVSLAI